MTRQTYREILSRVNSASAVLVAEGFETQFVEDLANLREVSKMTREEELAEHERHSTDLMMAYGYTTPNRDKPFAYADGVAVIPVHGSLVNRFHGSWGYTTGYNFIRAQMNAAMDDDDVKLIVFDHNSNGGEAVGCFELAREMKAVSKPKLAVVDANCYSAAYALATGADKIVCTPSGGVGSIGVMNMHIDISESLKADGVKVSIFAMGKHKADGNTFSRLSDEAAAIIQAGVEKRYDEFIELVVENRNLDSGAVRRTQSRSYRPDEALALGLIDAIQTPTDAVASFLAEMGSDFPVNEDEDETMTTPTTPAAKPAAAPAAAAPALDMTALQNMIATTVAQAVPGAIAAVMTAERSRVAGIEALDDAKRLPDLAKTLIDGGHTAETAAPILAAAAKALPAPAAPKLGPDGKPLAAAAPKTEPEATQPADTTRQAFGSSAFMRAMAESKNPTVAPDDATGPEGENAGPARARNALALIGRAPKPKAA